jgi:phage shock protein PspC (stress-responsive transcriptional regulator)
MKTVIQILVVLFLGLGLVQLVDLGLYLMNRPDSYLFNLGVVILAAMGVSFAFLLLYVIKMIKPENKKEKINN